MKSANVLSEFITVPPNQDKLWSGDYKIPWNETGFSRRMLAEHLSQEHELASRRQETITAQVDWSYRHICGGNSVKLLDIGCGPGLYLEKFTELGYRCRGIDISPASVEYARGRVGDSGEVLLGDIRTAEFGSGFDMALMIYGEFNVFSPIEIRGILDKLFASLKPGGTLLIEHQAYDTVWGTGTAANNWYKAASGLFSDKPHICLTENHWFEQVGVALQRFLVIDSASGGIATVPQHHQGLDRRRDRWLAAGSRIRGDTAASRLAVK